MRPLFHGGFILDNGKWKVVLGVYGLGPGVDDRVGPGRCSKCHPRTHYRSHGKRSQRRLLHDQFRQCLQCLVLGFQQRIFGLFLLFLFFFKLQLFAAVYGISYFILF